MRYFWKSVFLPVFSAAGAKVIVEVGAAAGAHTEMLVPWAKATGAMLHAIVPKPSFDAEALERDYPGAFAVHQLAHSSCIRSSASVRCPSSTEPTLS